MNDVAVNGINNIYLRAGYCFLLLATSGVTIALWLLLVAGFFESPSSFFDAYTYFLYLFVFGCLAIPVMLFYSIRFIFLGRFPRNGVVLYAGLIAGLIAAAMLLEPTINSGEKPEWGLILLALGPLVPGVILIVLFHRARAARK